MQQAESDAQRSVGRQAGAWLSAAVLRAVGEELLRFKKLPQRRGIEGAVDWVEAQRHHPHQHGTRPPSTNRRDQGLLGSGL